MEQGLFNFLGIWGVVLSLIIGGVTSSGQPANTGNYEVSGPSSQLVSTETLPVELPSDDKAISLAKCLSAKGAKMYGAFWCPHCAEQKNRFGDAVKFLPYVECDQKGENSQTQSCIDAKVEAYPTWQLAGKQTLVGEQTLDDLAKWSSCAY